jgi:hypothetical protein
MIKTLTASGAILLAATAFTLGTVSTAEASGVLFDRGLPAENLNNGAGSDRSNVSWQSAPGGDMVGDDFSIGATGQSYIIDSITVWGAQFDPLSEDIDNIELWFGAQGSQLENISDGNVTGNDNDNANIAHSFVSYADGVTTTYVGNGGFQYGIAQTVFSGLNLTIDGGVLYDFAIAADGPFGWFGHASNAALGGVPADGADDLYRTFDAAGNFLVSVDSADIGWDKSSDINVLITGTQVPPVPVPAALPLLAAGLGAFGVMGWRRRKANDA